MREDDWWSIYDYWQEPDYDDWLRELESYEEMMADVGSYEDWHPDA